jgi:salicylate hydroxylase
LRYTGDRILAAVDDFRDWLQSSYGSPLYALRRTELQRALHRKALDVGARFRMAATVAAIDPATGIVTLKSGETIDADLVIGADGIHSVARNALVGRPDPAIPTGELAYRYAFSPLSSAISLETVPRIVLQTDSLKDDPELVEMIVDHPSCLYIHFGPDVGRLCK